jgi:predicted ArsR family transcriptional regulator
MDDKMPRGRNQTVSTDELLKAIKQIDEPFGAEEVAEHVAIDGPQVKNRLQPLVKDGIINQKKIGRRNVYWPGG